MPASLWNLPRGCRGASWRERWLRPVAEDALRGLLGAVTAPYGEGWAAAAVRAWCAQRGWPLRADAAGNLIVRVPAGAGGARLRPALAFEAHLDHPALLVRRVRPDGCLEAEFFGGHPPERMAGGRVRLVAPPPDVVPAARTTVLEAGPRDPRTGAAPLLLAAPARPGRVRPAPGWIGAWDFPLRLTRRTVSNTVCDDLAGAASILAGLDLAWRNGLARPVLAYFTRCEENGFIGCLEGLRLGSFPPQVPVVVLECSPKLPHARPGDGPICRVGDRLSVYDAGLLALLEESARELARRVPGFRWQRKLMDGGACEATAYCCAGMSAAGLAVPLTNYHNVPDDRRRPGQAPEQIDRADQENLVLWVATLALGRKPGPAPAGPAPALERGRRERVGRLYRDEESGVRGRRPR